MWVSRSFMVCGTGKIRICYGVRPKIFGHEFNPVWFPAGGYLSVSNDLVFSAWGHNRESYSLLTQKAIS